MGWQDRDWAKLDDRELEQLYGIVPANSSATRVSVWCALAVLGLAVGAFAYTQRSTPGMYAAPAQPLVLYGIRGSQPTVDELSPGGMRTVCTEEAFVAAAHRWSCLVWTLNTRNLPVVEPAPYEGPCSHLLAATDQPRWTCLGVAPLTPDELPPPPSASSS
jgi:hypothetical protein